MAEGLSSNWKKLQAKIKTESLATHSSLPKGQLSPKHQNKKRKATNPLEKDSTGKKPALRKAASQPHRRHRSSKATSERINPPIRNNAMGATQSSAVIKGTPATVAPSLALWAHDSETTAEELAEAYNLGPRQGRPSKSTATTSSASIAEDRRRVNEGLAVGIEVGKYIGIDCEMVGIGPGGQDHMLARVSCVDFHGNQVYDSFVIPRAPVTNYRTTITGITASTLRPPAARPFDQVQADVANLLNGRILVGHDVRHDLAVLELTHSAPHTRDTSSHSTFRKYGHGPRPALRVLAREVLGIDDFQKAQHSSVEDARVAMLVFRAKKSEFDVENEARFGKPPTGVGASNHKTNSKKSKARKKKKKKK